MVKVGASSATMIGTSATISGFSWHLGTYGVVRFTTNGSAISELARRAIGPNRRSRIERLFVLWLRNVALH
jgi:hypothetical protein